MKAIYTVIQIEEDYITVAEENPMNPQKKLSEIKIKNLSNFDMHLGSHVYIGFPKKIEAFYGILGLFFPIIAAALGLFLSPHFASLIKIEPTELIKAACTIAFFAIATSIVFFCSRKLPVKMQLQITGVLD